MESRIRLSVIVPTYRSIEHLGLFLEQMRAELRHPGFSSEVVVVDDGSDDGTAQILLALAKKSDSVGNSSVGNPCAGDATSGDVHSGDGEVPRLKVICLRENVGQQQATLCGIRNASGEVMVTVDDDLQHPLEKIFSMVEKLSAGYDLVYGVPFGNHGSVLRRFGSGLRDVLFLFIFGRRSFGIRPTSFRAFTRDLADNMIDRAEGFLYLSAEFFRLSPRIGLVPVEYRFTGSHHSRYPLLRLLRTFAGLALYLPIFPVSLRGRYGGMRWEITDMAEGEL